MDATLWLWVAIAAGVLAVLYGVFSMMLILRLPAGNAACRRSPPRCRPAPRRI